MLLASACGQSRSDIEIGFVARYGDDPLACGTSSAAAELTDLRFYLHDLALQAADGSWNTITLDADSPWQQGDLAMIDLEDGASRCQNGTAETNRSISGSVGGDGLKGLRFTLGVPFDRNHADPLIAAAPLDDSAMHWHWRSGYKFLRAGVGTSDDGFWIHLGSTGCNGTVGNITGCRSPNRVTVLLPAFDPGVDRVVLDLSALLEGTDLGDGEPGDCSSGPSEDACRAPFAALGIDFDSGERNSEQRVFRTAAR